MDSFIMLLMNHNSLCFCGCTCFFWTFQIQKNLSLDTDKVLQSEKMVKDSWDQDKKNNDRNISVRCYLDKQ